MQKIVPLGKKVLIKEKEPEKYFKGSSILNPHSTNEKNYFGYIIAKGKGVEDVSEGDLVKYASYVTPIEIEHMGEPHLLLGLADILAIVIDE